MLLLSQILSRDEVLRPFTVDLNIKHKALFLTAYDAGLLLWELLNLHGKDRDSRRKVIHIPRGKGKRDCDARLTPGLRELLRGERLADCPGGLLSPTF